jgi:hypothetical protein
LYVLAGSNVWPSVRPRLAVKNLRRGRGHPASIPDPEFPAKFKEILTILIGVLAATKPSQVTSQIDPEDEIVYDSEHKDVLYKPAFNEFASDSWEKHNCPSVLRVLGDTIDFMGCIYQLRQVADEYQRIASRAQERMEAYDVDPRRQEDYSGLAETFQTVREQLQRTEDESQDMRLVVFLPMLQKALEAARFEVEEIEDVVEGQATSSEEDTDREQDSDKEG